jgi:hypothetical protein
VAPRTILKIFFIFYFFVYHPAMPIYNALAQPSQNALTAPFFGNPNIQRQGQRIRQLAQARDVNTMPDPRTYAAAQGLMGTRPDEMGFSVLHPDYQGIRNVANPAYGLSIAAQMAPFLAPLTKGMPVGASIQDISNMTNAQKRLFNSKEFQALKGQERDQAFLALAAKQEDDRTELQRQTDVLRERQALQATVHVATVTHICQSYTTLVINNSLRYTFLIPCLYTPHLMKFPMRLLTFL